MCAAVLVAGGVFIFSTAQAQVDPNRQRPATGGFGGGMPGQMGMGGGGGGGTMVADGGHLYIMRGNVIYKMHQGSMKLVGEAVLPGPQPGQVPFGQPTRPAQNRGGGGGFNPPPK